MEREEEYIECTQKINRAINEILNTASPLGRRNAAIGSAQESIRDGERHIEFMEELARNIVGPTRNSSMSKVRRFKADLAALKREVNKSSKTLNKGQDNVKDQVELYGRGGVSSWDKATHDSLNNSTQLLEDSRRVIAQTEEIGDAVASDLEGQRHQLLNAHGQVMDMKTLTSDARRLLKQMSWNDLKEKAVLIGIIIILIISIILVIYYRFIKSDQKNK